MDIIGQKSTIGMKILDTPEFDEYKFSLIQGIGYELEPCVKVGDKVKIGTKIAGCKSTMLGADLHSSVSGEVVKIEREEIEKDMNANVITIKNDKQDLQEERLKTLKNEEITLQTLINRLDLCGVLGCGGGGFPLGAKLEHFTCGEEKHENGIDKKHLRHCIINGTSSDGYYTADISVMMEQADKIVQGIDILRQATKCDSFIIVVRKGIEKYVRELISKTEEKTYIYFKTIDNKLCVGNENVIAKKILGINVCNGELLVDHGVMCSNVQTICALADAVSCGVPQTARVITFGGGSAKKPCNVRVKVGTKFADLVEFLGGEKFALSEFEHLKLKAQNSYSQYLDMREKFKKDEINVEVRDQMVAVRKEANKDIMEFLKNENLHSRELLAQVVCGGGLLSGTAKDKLAFSVTKTSICLLLLNEKEKSKREKLVKCFHAKMKRKNK